MGDFQQAEAGDCAVSTPLGRRPASSNTIGDIQSAARLEFAEHGFDSTTVDGIARRAKVSKQLLYYYFGNKADLYAVILEEAAIETTTFDHKSRYEQLKPDLAIRTFIGDIFADFVKRPQIIQMTVDEAKHAFTHVSKKSALARVLQTAIQALEEIVLRGQTEGAFRGDIDPDALFWTIYAMATAWFSHRPMIALVSSTKFDGTAGLDGTQGMETWRMHTEMIVMRFISTSGDGATT